MDGLVTVLKEVSESLAAVSLMRETLLQMTDTINQGPQLAGAAADGAGSDGHSKREEISLAVKYLHKAWTPRSTKTHWMVRACVNLTMVNMSVPELQSALRKTAYATPVANQLRCMSSFQVLAYVPRDATFAASDMTALPLDHAASRPEYDVPKYTEPLNRIYRLEPSFNEIFTKFSMVLLTHDSVVRSCMLALAGVLRGRMLVLAGAFNHDIGIRKSDLSIFVRDKCSGTMPPGAGTIVEMFLSPPRNI